MSGKEPSPSSELSNWAQIRGATRMIPEGTDAGNVTAEQIANVVDRALLFMQNFNRRRKDIAKAIGYSAGVISEFVKFAYTGNKGQVAIDLDRWLNAEEELAQKPRTTQFVWTTIAMMIKSVAGYCLEGSREKRTIGMIYGPDTSGIGKTTAMRAVHEELGPRRSAFLTIEKVDANPTSLLRKLCASVHVDEWGSNAQKYRRVTDKVKDRAFIFLIDQIQNLRWAKQDKPFFILADLYDRTGTAQLWSGTADLVEYLDSQRRKSSDESLTQIRSRIFPCVDLMASIREGGTGEPLFSIEDIRHIFHKNQLRLVGAAPRFLCQISNQPDSGALRLCVNLVEYATSLALRRGMDSIDEPLLREAMQAGFQPRRAELLFARIDERPQTRAKVG